jgi:trehalose-6-phosphate synthase
MRLTYRLSFPLILGVTAVSLSLAFIQTRADTRGLRQDLERNTLVLAESLAKSAEPLVESHSYRDLQRLVDRFRDREQVAGAAVYDVAVYDMQGKPLAMTAGLAGRLRESAAAPPENRWEPTEYIRLAGKPMFVAALPLGVEAPLTGSLVVFHEAAYIDLQTRALWRRALTGVAIQTILIACVTLLTVRWGLGRPMRRMAHWLHQLRIGKAERAPEMPETGVFEPLTLEVTRLASSLTAARAAAEHEARLRDQGDSDWTAERLRVFVQNRLGGKRLFAVSNREPYEHFHRAGGIEAKVPPSGLVTALEPILRACDGTWVAQATGDADRDTVDECGRVRVPPDHPQYTLRRVWLTEEEEQGFYFGFANEGLWPLCHIAHTRPVFRMEDWEHYRTVNRKFAEALLEEIDGEESPAVLVQDYHFALLPRMLKEARPDARVAIFWHIPWPNPEAFGICPWQKELLDGLLGADLIGFHIQAHCNNFLETVDRVLEARIAREHYTVSRREHSTSVRPFPISVTFDNRNGGSTFARRNGANGSSGGSSGIRSNGGYHSESRREPTTELPHMERARLLDALGVRAAFLGVGVDRVDYTKGIPERFDGLERFFEKYPAYRREFTFVQIGSPSRAQLPRYQELMQSVSEQAERINRRFQTSEWKPIVFLNRQHSHTEIQPYYRLADLCLVTSLHDGMNLVAKEFVAAREDGQGVLVLSQFAGAAHELHDALVINPYDTEEIADSIRRALEMAPEERRARMEHMRSTLRENNIYRWAGNLIGELCDIRLPEPAMRGGVTVACST